MHFTDILSATSGAAWLPLADAIIKATLLFAAAGVASLALRRATAAARHLVWTLALASAVVLPALSLALPRWQLPLVTLATATTPPVKGELPLDASAVSPSGMAGSILPRGTSTPQVSAKATNVTTASPVGRPVAAIVSLETVPWPYVLLAVWAIGVALVLLRLVTGVLGVQWLSRRTVAVNDAPWLPLARTLATELGLRGLVFRRSARATMPMAWGVLRPAVLMPSDADDWPAERLRIVLLHELAHVKRRDCLTHMLAQVSCALYWFNPLVWVAARHLRMERERACDDLVLAAGTRGSDYADQLLQIARRTRGGRFPRLFGAASLAMAQRSQLEGRLMAILDPTVPRAGLSRFRTIAASSMFACAVVPLASVQPWTMETRGESRPTPTPIHHNRNAQGPERPGALSSDSAVAGRDVQVDRLPEHRSALMAAVPDVPVVPAATAPEIVIAADLPGTVTAALAAAVSVLAPTPQPVTAPAPGAQTSADVAPAIAGDGKRKPADPRTVAALTAALKDTDKGVREAALHALVQLHDPSVFDPLVQALTDVDADVREHAASGLGRMRDRRAVEPLSRALKDADADVREQAAFALGQLRDPAAVDALAAAMRDVKTDVREQVVFALGQLRDRRAVEPLISALKDADVDIREQAAFALGQIRDVAAVEALVIALKDSVAGVRGQVAFALGQLRDPRAIDALTAALKDASADVRQQAAFALGQIAR